MWCLFHTLIIMWYTWNLILYVTYTSIKKITLFKNSCLPTCHIFFFKLLEIWFPCFRFTFLLFQGFPQDSAGKESTCNAGDLGLMTGLGKPPWEENCYSLQYSGLENSADCIVHELANSWTHFHVHFSVPATFVNSLLLSSSIICHLRI